MKGEGASKKASKANRGGTNKAIEPVVERGVKLDQGHQVALGSVAVVEVPRVPVVPTTSENPGVVVSSDGRSSEIRLVSESKRLRVRWESPFFADEKQASLKPSRHRAFSKIM